MQQRMEQIHRIVLQVFEEYGVEECIENILDDALLKQKEAYIQKLLHDNTYIYTYFQQQLDQLKNHYQQQLSYTQQKLTHQQQHYNSITKVQQKQNTQPKQKQLQHALTEIELLKDKLQHSEIHKTALQKQNLILQQKIIHLLSEKQSLTYDKDKLHKLIDQNVQKMKQIEKEVLNNQDIHEYCAKLQGQLKHLQQGIQRSVMRGDKLQMQRNDLLVKLQTRSGQLYVMDMNKQQLLNENERLYKQIVLRQNQFQNNLKEKSNIIQFNRNQENQKIRLVVSSLNQRFQSLQSNMEKEHSNPPTQSIPKNTYPSILYQLKHLKTQLQTFLKQFKTQHSFLEQQLSRQIIDGVKAYLIKSMVKPKQVDMNDYMERKEVSKIVKKEGREANMQIQELKIKMVSLQNQVINLETVLKLQKMQNQNIKVQNDNLYVQMDRLNKALQQKMPQVVLNHYKSQQKLAKQRLIIEERIESEFKKQIHKLMFDINKKQNQIEKLRLAMQKQKLHYENKLEQRSRGYIKQENVARIRSNRVLKIC